METLLKVLGVLALIVILAVIFAFPVKLLWNWLMPVIFSLPKISLSQALGLMLLAGFLTKGSSTSSK